MAEVVFSATGDRRADGTFVVAVVGELDLYTAPDLELAILLNGGESERVVVDLSKCTFIDSSGLGILVDTQRRMGVHALVVVAGGLEVRRAFEVSGLDRRLALYPTLESALNRASV